MKAEEAQELAGQKVAESLLYLFRKIRVESKKGKFECTYAKKLTYEQTLYLKSLGYGCCQTYTDTGRSKFTIQWPIRKKKE